MRAKYTKVRARSANEGSGTAGWSLDVPVPACFLMDEEDIVAPSWQFNRLLKNSRHCIFWEGHDFSRAIKPFILVIPNRLQPVRNLLFGVFQQPPVRPIPETTSAHQ